MTLATVDRSDIYYHLPLLAEKAKGRRVIEFGVRAGNSTIAMIEARPLWMRSYDIQDTCVREVLNNVAKSLGVDFKFTIANDLSLVPEPCDVLFIDTYHTRVQLKAELDLHGVWATEIIIHDTELFGEFGEDREIGINTAIAEWLFEHKEYRITYTTKECCGLTILARLP